MKTSRTLQKLTGTGLFLNLLLGCGTGALAAPALRVEALFPGRAVLSIDGKRRVLEVGKPAVDGVILLAADSRRARLQVGEAVRELTVNERVGASFTAPAQRPGLTLSEARDGHFYVDGTINGSLVRFVVDTGASTVALSGREARKLGLMFLRDGTPGTVETAAGPAPAHALRLRELKLGPIVLSDVQAIVLEGDFPRVALLGQSCLERLHMTRDGSVLALRQR